MIRFPKQMINRVVVVSILTLLSILMPAQAEQKKTLGSWDVHYIVIPTTFLTPEVARAYDIRRSKVTALVNISVLDKVTQAAQDVEVTGIARNLLGTTTPLTFKKVAEGDAIYYLATVGIDDKETLRFTIDLEQGKQSQQLKFQQLMYEE
ncbi:DUF4426 domain-containing protein [Glaciecola sp. 1036]|uniref:DUF4426 domain-containing protein n=1 Tax=Alteromonadaceae TaxID=72275 RepID=UPI003D028412